MTEYGLSISYFEPYKNAPEECGENGLPVCPSTTKIIGNGQLLVLKDHENLQELAHIEKGKQERILIVTETMDESARLDRSLHGPMRPEVATDFATKLFSALNFLHQNGIVHRSLSPSTIYLDAKSQKLKLSNWFLWTLSNCGQMCPFDNKCNIKYLPIEDVVKFLRAEKKPSHFTSDIYSAGLILLEAVLGIRIWKSKKNNRQLIHEKLKLTKNCKSSNVAEIIVQELGLAKHFEALDEKLKKVITVATRIGFESIRF
jgi:serine/threonine protein kinase